MQSQFFESATQVSVGGRIYQLVSKIHRGNDGKLAVISRDAGEDTIITKNRVQADE